MFNGANIHMINYSVWFMAGSFVLFSAPYYWKRVCVWVCVCVCVGVCLCGYVGDLLKNN